MKYQQQLISLIQQDEQLMQQLRCVQQLGLTNCCIAAGAIRNLVWDALHQHKHRTPLNDVDVIYFDADNLTAIQEKNYTAALQCLDPATPWEVVNQARVHLWHSALQKPNSSLIEGMKCWPETATSVGAYLDEDGIQIIAPFGLTDLFELKLTHNANSVSTTDFLTRQWKKQFQVKWPNLQYSSIGIETVPQPVF